MFRAFFSVAILFCFGFFPLTVAAFEVSPSVVDVSFATGVSEVTQVFSLVNTSDQVRLYEAELQLVSFAPDGSIVGFSDIPSDFDAVVSPPIAEIAPGVEQVFTVVFPHPEQVAADQVFALLAQEQSLQGGEILSGFVALLFPQDVAQTLPGSFRIDAFAVVPSSDEDSLEVLAQFTNTGGTLVRPASIIIVSNRFGTEIGRFVFASHEGRLPVGTTRTISDTLFSPDFGFWHVGGPVTFTLMSVPVEGGDVQQASVELATGFGAGVLFGGIFFIFLGACLVVFLFKKRGILRS